MYENNKKQLIQDTSFIPGRHLPRLRILHVNLLI
nr:hypothetical protein [Microctonus hyperodae filamentous virus]